MKEEKEAVVESKSEKIQDLELEKKEKKKKARRRTRGPYRKAHATW